MYAMQYSFDTLLYNGADCVSLDGIRYIVELYDTRIMMTRCDIKELKELVEQTCHIEEEEQDEEDEE